MPNHFLTIGLASRDYQRLEQRGKDDYDDDHFDSLKDANHANN